MNPVAQRLGELRERVHAAAQRAGRKADAVRLLGVAKRIADDAIVESVAAGLGDVAENYVQEAVGRRAHFEQAFAEHALDPPEWHFIGRLQSNKAKSVVGAFTWLHTLDRASLGTALEKHCAAQDVRLRVLVQVNTSGEAQKGGVAPDALEPLLAESEAWPHLDVAGLMTLPAPAPDPEDVRPAFAQLRELRDHWQATLPSLRELSMGMSGDFEVAVEEGATLVRLGTALYGARPPA